MSCGFCRSDAAPREGICPDCGEAVAPPRNTLVASGTEVAVPGLDPAGPRSPSTAALAPDQDFGTRYRIIRLLGSGGMGSVYQAWDRELEVAVAVKVIRPEATADATTAQNLERRFKRELLLARQVTHKNVVRIHDIGEIDGVKYITMPYVEGSDLATILSRAGRMSVSRAMAIGRQVAAGLVAAHEAGVVHRDLKPANIMIDAEGQALIMDFGIARSTSGATGTGMTAAGGVLGTVEYMAPEQARGEQVDQRADLYAWGLILRDMLQGGRRGAASTVLAELMDRMREAPPPLRSWDPGIPEALDAILTRCLQPAPENRYQTSAELLADLERLGEGRPLEGTRAIEPLRQPRRFRRRLAAAIAAAAALAALGAAAIGIQRWSAAKKPTVGVSGPARPVVSLAVLPFRNASGDAALDSLGTSLTEVLVTELGEASHIRTIPTARLREVLRDLRIDPKADLAPAERARVADFASAKTVLWGQYARFGDEIRIDGTIQDLERQTLSPVKATAANQAALLGAVAEIARLVQERLAAGSANVLEEMKASAWRPSTKSFEAMRLYNEGLQRSWEGDQQAAQASLDASVREDPEFALAYAALAQVHADLGQEVQAVQQARRAMGLAESLQPQERYLVAATFHRITNDAGKAIETYEQLLKVSPNNARIRFELAGLYERTGDLEKAAAAFARAVELDPKHVAGLTAVGRVAIKRGNPQASLEPLNNALSLAIQLRNDEARANALQAIGVAYKRLGQPAEALKQYQESLAIKRQIGQKRGMAVSLGEIAQIQEMVGNPQEAVRSYNEALAIQREIGDRSGASTTLINLGSLLNEGLGRPDEALALFREALSIVRESGDRSGEALALNNTGAAYLAKGQFAEAQTYFERALDLREQTKVPREIADTLHNLGETLGRMGKYDQALARYLRALELRRSDGDTRASAVESYSIGTIFDYQGRYGAAVTSKGEALEAFRDLNLKEVWLGEILSGLGYSLSLAGRADEAARTLDEALALARELANPGLVAQILRFQAEAALHRGDATGAGRLAGQAASEASRAADRSLDLWARFAVTTSAAASRPARAQAVTLARIGRESATGGLAYLSAASALEGAHTLLRVGDHRQARRLAEEALARAETLGLRDLAARSEYVLAAAMRLAKDPQAARHYATALRLLEEMKQEDGSQRVLERADLAPIYAECGKWATAR